MTPPKGEKDTIAQMMERLLSGPARPGQAFNMPGCNYDGLYRMARRIKALFDSQKEDHTPVCLCSEDRAVMAAALLASTVQATVRALARVMVDLGELLAAINEALFEATDPEHFATLFW